MFVLSTTNAAWSLVLFYDTYANLLFGNKVAQLAQNNFFINI